LNSGGPKINQMKTTLFPAGLMFLLFLSSCRHDLGIDQVPDDIIQTVPCPTLYSRILELFPEHSRHSRDVLFSDTIQKQVVLKKESQVFVTYISEGAGYRNTFGWYAYNKSSPPSSASQLQLNVLFPDVSNTVLHSGDRLLLQDQSFAAGTVIGFFLIVGGWQEDGTIDWTKQTIYTDYQFNPSQAQLHILFEEKTCGDIVLAFEDMGTTGEPQGSDNDFNDILFTVSDNNSDLVNTAFENETIVSW